MTDHSDLIARLRKPAPKFGLEEFDPTYDVRQEAASALSSQSLSLLEAREEIERLKGLVAGIRECPQEPWQDIATAPKDGTFVLTCIGDSPWLPAISHWGSYAGVTRWGADPETFMEEDHFMNYWADCHYEPTHWQPLPVPFEGSGRTLADATKNPPLSDLSSLRKGAEERIRELEKALETAEWQRDRLSKSRFHWVQRYLALRDRAVVRENRQ